MAPAKYNLEGKVALITGAARGIGRDYALTLARSGCSIVVNYHSSAKPAQALVAELKQEHNVDAIAVQGDVSSVASIEQLFARAKENFGEIDIVISNAGIEHFGPLDEVTPEAFDKVYGTNVRGQFFVAQQAYKHVTRGGGGRVILTSSISKNYSIAQHSVYASSKGAIEAMVRNMSQDFGPFGITINAVAPGGTWTDMAVENAKHYIPGGEEKTEEEVKEAVKKMSALGRVGYPKDIANVVAFLCSEDGEWVNGQTIQIAGQ